MKNNIEGRQIKKELTPEEKKIAMSLETISCLGKKDKVFLVLVWRNLKTASAISLEAGVPESVVRDLEKRIKEAGLFFKKTDHIIKEGEEMFGLKNGRICFVANNQKDLDLMSELWFGDHHRDEKVYKEIGRMSSYPQTAIDTYEKIMTDIFNKGNIPTREKSLMKELILSEAEKIDLLKKEPNLFPFARLFYMSKAHWKSEIEIVRKWAEEIKLATPALYQSFIEDFKRSENAV